MEAKTATPRFLLIDGLRGVAAFSVLLFHVATSDFFRHSPGVLGPLNTVLKAYGFLGVEIFFVISGFVIAYSLRNAKIDARFVRTFVIRRSLRLDPPYWAAIALAVLVSVVLTKFFHATTFLVPSTTTVLTHFFYLQGIFGKPQILIVFWTLCYEIQFYLTFLLLQFVAQRLNPGKSGHLLKGILIATSVGSFAAFLYNPSAGPWAYNWWYLFSIGAVVCHEMLQKRFTFAPVMTIMLFGVGIGCRHLEPVAGAVGLLTLLAACRWNGLCTWLSNSTIQFLGRISYSLYLTHTLVLQMLTAVLLRLHFAAMLWSIPAFLTLIAVPIGLAEVFYRAIEKPSHRLATNFGRRARPSTTPLPAPICVSSDPPIAPTATTSFRTE